MVKYFFDMDEQTRYEKTLCIIAQEYKRMKYRFVCVRSLQKVDSKRSLHATRAMSDSAQKHSCVRADER